MIHPCPAFARLAGQFLAGAFSTLLAAPVMFGAMITEDFTGTSADLTARNWVITGNATITGGYARLTQAINTQSGSVILKQPFSSALGINVQFDYYMAGGSGADGLSFFLLDGDQTTPNAGAAGGSLGYLWGLPATPGASKAYMGLGVDRYGNYSNTSWTGLSGGSQAVEVPNTFSIRGPATAVPSLAANGEYKFVAGSLKSYGAMQGGWRKVNFTIFAGKITLRVSANNGVDWTSIYDGFDFASTAAYTGYSLPPTLILGFGASTGGSNNEHRIDNLVVTQPVDHQVTITSTPAATQRVGATVAYQITVKNAGPNADPAAAFSATIPADIADVNWSYDISGTPTGSGTSHSIAPTLNLPKDAVATFSITGTVAASAAGKTLSLTANAAPSSDCGDTNLADNTRTWTADVRPAVIAATVPADSTYTSDGILEFALTFGEPVTVTGAPQLELLFGTTTRYATYASMDETGTVLLFRYTVQAGDGDADGIQLGSLVVGGGAAITGQTGGRDAVLSLSGVPSTIGVKALTVPGVTAGAASAVLPTGATLNATVANGGADTTVVFEYGPTTSYGATVAATTGGSITADAASTAAVVSIHGLTPNTTYHYRAVATNSKGSTPGADQSFTTAIPQPGNALAFDGTDAVLFTTPPAYNHTALTIEAWVRNTNGTDDGGQIVQWGQTAGDDLAAFGLSEGRLVFGIRQDSDWESVTGTRRVNDGRWHHVAVVKSGNAAGDIALYVDGEADAVSLHWNNAAAGTDATVTRTPDAFDRLCIGAMFQHGVTGYGAYQAYKGAIDEVRIWTVARTADEIRTARTTTLTGAEPGLAAYHRFDSGSAGNANAAVTTLADVKTGGVACHGTLTGFALSAGNITSNWVESYAFVAPVAEAATAVAGTSFAAHWAAPVNGLAPAGYRLDVATDAGFTTFVDGYNDRDVGAVLTHTVAGLSGSTSYWYRVRAARAMAGVGANSAAATATTLAVPVVTAVTVPSAGAYKAGAALGFTVTFSAPISVTDEPRLPVTIGGSTRYAVYSGGTGTATLSFSYTVQDGDADTDGIALAAALQLNGGTLQDASGTPPTLTLNNVGSTVAITVDTTVPATPATPSTPWTTTTDRRPAFGGTAEPGAIVKLYDGPTLIGSTTSAGNGAWSITPGSSLGLGAHVMKVTVTDAAGNVSSASPALTITIEEPLSSQTITFGSLADRTTADAPFTLSATASSGLRVTFAVVSGPATISGGTVTLTGAPGVVTIRASQSGDSSYESAPDVERSFVVTLAIPVVNTPTQAPTPEPGGTATLTVPAAMPSATYQWQRNGEALTNATNPTLTLPQVQPPVAGLYTYTASTAGGTTVTSEPVIVGLSTTDKVIGTGAVVNTDIRHPNGNVYDQLLLEGTGATFTADANQITRMSYVDLTGDIVQVELSGAGTLSLVMDDASAPAPAANYTQPGVNYVRGHVGIVITGANETTNVSVFSVGRANAVNQTLFRDEVSYDGVANVAFVAIQSTNGKFGGVRTGNVEYFAQTGFTGLYAPGVTFTGPVNIGDIQAHGQAQPVLVAGSAPNVRIAGGSLEQPNGQPVQVGGLSHVEFAEGRTSQGGVLPAQTNHGVLEQDGVDVTDLIVAGQ